MTDKPIPMPTRRQPDNRPLRRAILAADLMATILEQIGPDESNPFARAIGHALEAWDYAKQDLRREIATQAFTPPAFAGWSEAEDQPEKTDIHQPGKASGYYAELLAQPAQPTLKTEA